MNRRRFLALGGATATSVLAGCSSIFSDPPSETPTETAPPDGSTDGPRTPSTATANPENVDPVTRYGLKFDRTLDVVADLDADPTGETPIDSIIEETYEDGTLLEFPLGSYLVERSHSFDAGIDTWGMVGTGESRRDVEFVFPEGNETAQNPDNHYVLDVQSGRNHLVANMTMQQTRDRTTGVGIILVLSDGLYVEDLEFAGYNPVSGRNPGSCLIPDVTDMRGVGVVRNFTCTGGGVEDTYPARKVGILCGPFHVGELRLIGHDIRNMGSHPHYTSNHRGCIRTEDCYFENNDNTNVRISGGQSGGHPNKDSWVKNCTVVVDTDNADHVPEGERYEFVRGIKCDFGEDVLIEDTDVVFRSAPASPYCVGVQHNHGKATLRNVRIRSDVDGIGPLFEAQQNADPVVLENVSFTGTAAGFYDTDGAVVVRRRNKCVIRDSCIHLTGGNQNGISLSDCEDCLIENVGIDVPAEQIVTQNAEPTVRGITGDGNCQVPNVDG